jgi:hypothetical protein
MLLDMSALKEGEVIAVEEETPQEERIQATGRKVRLIKDVASTALRRKGR